MEENVRSDALRFSDTIFTEDVIHNPYPFYHKMREEGPVYFHSQLNTWLVFNYSDFKAVDTDATHFGRGEVPGSQQRRQVSNLGSLLNKMLFMTNPPDQQRIRDTFQKYFSPAQVRVIQPMVSRLINNQFDGVRGHVSIEFMADLVRPLMSSIIGEMLGIPQEDRALLQQWSKGFVPMIDPWFHSSLQARTRAEEAATGFQGYFGRFLTEKVPEGLIAVLADVTRHGVLSRSEFISTCFTLWIAGYETTSVVLGNVIRAFMEEPEQLLLLRGQREQPGFILSSIHEFIRYYTSPQHDSRFTKEAITLPCGVSIPANAMLLAFHGAANRDPQQFGSSADQLDIKRFTQPGKSMLTDSSGFGHVGFGGAGSPFFCVGAHLSLTIYMTFLDQLLRRTTALQLKQLVMGDTLGFWGPKILQATMQWNEHDC